MSVTPRSLGCLALAAALAWWLLLAQLLSLTLVPPPRLLRSLTLGPQGMLLLLLPQPPLPPVPPLLPPLLLLLSLTSGP